MCFAHPSGAAMTAELGITSCPQSTWIFETRMRREPCSEPLRTVSEAFGDERFVQFPSDLPHRNPMGVPIRSRAIFLGHLHIAYRPIRRPPLMVCEARETVVGFIFDEVVDVAAAILIANAYDQSSASQIQASRLVDGAVPPARKLKPGKAGSEVCAGDWGDVPKPPFSNTQGAERWPRDDRTDFAG